MPANLFIEWVVCSMVETNISISSWSRRLLEVPCQASTSIKKNQYIVVYQRQLETDQLVTGYK